MARSSGARGVAAALVGMLVVGAGGYVTADALDLVPGVVTLQPAPEPPAPFPTAPGAVTPPTLDAVLAQPDPTAPVPDAEQVTALSAALAADPAMGSSVGVVVADALTGEVLADVDGDRPRTPASTVKVLTALAALTALGPERTLSTTVVQQAPGRIALVGGGDMMLAAGAGDPDAVVGRAGLADLAAETARNLRLAGTTEVTLGVDDTLFSGPAIHPGWKPGDVQAGYVAPVASVAVNIAKTRDEPYPPRHADPAVHAAQQLVPLLAEHGVTVVGPVTRVDTDPSAVPLATVRSAPVAEIVEYVLHVSENTISEVLGRLVALEQGLPGSFQGATGAVTAEVAAQGIDVTGTRIADSSGLAEGSLVPTRLLVDVVLLATDPERTDLLPVAVDLPVAGWQGTLADRYRDGRGRGTVRAKTGSLPGVTSLAGTVQTAYGRQLVFAVLADATPPGGQWAPRAAIDAYVQQLAACGCQLP